MRGLKFTKFILVSVLILTSQSVFSQVEVLKKWTDEGGEHRAFFVYRDSDEKHLTEMAQVIEKAWTLSKVELVSIDEYLSLETKTGDFTMLMGISHTTMTSQNGVASNFVDLYLDVRVQSEVRQEILGRIVLSPNGQTVFDVCRGPETLEQVIYNQYKNDSNFSWNFPYLSAGLSTVANALEDGELISIKENVKDPDLTNIKNAVLYVGDAVNTEQNRFNGKDSESDQKESVTKAYPHKFEIVSNEIINSKYISDELEYVFMSQKFGRGKYLIVINAKENRIVYTKVEKGRYNFRAKDIKELSARIGK